MESDHLHSLLGDLPAIRCHCDLDLLVFFAKHPRTLMGSEQLARLLGYRLTEIARSLEALLAGGVLTRAHAPARGARMYVFATDGTSAGSLRAVVQCACTRDGRLALRRILKRSPAGGTEALTTPVDEAAAAQGGA